MKITQYQVDAFAARVFEGNPAAICPLDDWLPDALLQSIAQENNLSETAFYVAEGEGFRLRWFTPVAEVDLCGHATLATAHVLFNQRGYQAEEIVFATRSGELRVRREGELLSMNFPATPAKPCTPPAALMAALGIKPAAVLAADDYLVVIDSESAIRALAPDFFRLSELDRRGVCVTAPGDEVDFVSRFFAPRYGIPEDPVTGSAHCILTPYWAERLGRQQLQARQLSPRGGDISCQLAGDRVILAGRAVTFMEATIDLGTSFSPSSTD
jgi:PhzF family phenazine biosynthesis protein